MVFVLDNYDSFTYNLVQYMGELGAEVVVRRNDELTPEEVEAEMERARGYGDLKAAVAAAVIDYLAPVRERYSELRADEGRLEAILADGAARAREIAGETLADVRERMGVGAPHQIPPAPTGTVGG